MSTEPPPPPNIIIIAPPLTLPPFFCSLRRQGPSRPTLDFITSINLCTTENNTLESVVSCQEALCRLLFPTSNQVSHERVFNRRQVLLETTLAVDKSVAASPPDSPHRNRRLTEAPSKTRGCEIMVSWEGDDDYTPNAAPSSASKHTLFYSAKKVSAPLPRTPPATANPNTNARTLARSSG